MVEVARSTGNKPAPPAVSGLNPHKFGWKQDSVRHRCDEAGQNSVAESSGGGAENDFPPQGNPFPRRENHFSCPDHRLPQQGSNLPCDRTCFPLTRRAASLIKGQAVLDEAQRDPLPGRRSRRHRRHFPRRGKRWYCCGNSRPFAGAEQNLSPVEASLVNHPVHCVPNQSRPLQGPVRLARVGRRPPKVSGKPSPAVADRRYSRLGFGFSEPRWRWRRGRMGMPVGQWVRSVSACDEVFLTIR